MISEFEDSATSLIAKLAIGYVSVLVAYTFSPNTLKASLQHFSHSTLCGTLQKAFPYHRLLAFVACRPRHTACSPRVTVPVPEASLHEFSAQLIHSPFILADIFLAA